MQRKVVTSYRCCFVPQCGNSTKNHPGKIFVSVPKPMKLRKKWFKAANRIGAPSNSNFYSCCEDHFDLREDLENYVRFSIMGGPAKIKTDVLPHKFDCQPHRKRLTEHQPRLASIERKRKNFIKEILESYEKSAKEGENVTPSNKTNANESKNGNDNSEMLIMTDNLEDIFMKQGIIDEYLIIGDGFTIENQCEDYDIQIEDVNVENLPDKIYVQHELNDELINKDDLSLPNNDIQNNLDTNPLSPDGILKNSEQNDETENEIEDSDRSIAKVTIKVENSEDIFIKEEINDELDIKDDFLTKNQCENYDITEKVQENVECWPDILCVKQELNDELIIKEDLSLSENDVQNDLGTQDGNLLGLVVSSSNFNNENDNPSNVAEDWKNPLECIVCHAIFPSIHRLQKHTRIHLKKQHKCKTCQKTYINSYRLAKHKLTHTLQTYACTICQQEFKDLIVFKSHINIHSNTPHFACEICEKTFIKLERLKAHLRKAHNPYTCDICDKSFRCSASLNKHLRAHRD